MKFIVIFGIIVLILIIYIVLTGEQREGFANHQSYCDSWKCPGCGLCSCQWQFCGGRPLCMWKSYRSGDVYKKSLVCRSHESIGCPPSKLGCCKDAEHFHKVWRWNYPKFKPKRIADQSRLHAQDSHLRSSFMAERYPTPFLMQQSRGLNNLGRMGE